MPVLRQGNIIRVPEHTLQVVQACSSTDEIIDDSFFLEEGITDSTCMLELIGICRV
ncbi:MAG: exosortase/archaeosortase family protein [Desulfobacteraceae bacterium]|nr:exosortase/archaeosortase family protein [Desulfobacteraceae bacterium]